VIGEALSIVTNLLLIYAVIVSVISWEVLQFQVVNQARAMSRNTACIPTFVLSALVVEKLVQLACLTNVRIVMARVRAVSTRYGQKETKCINCCRIFSIFLEVCVLWLVRSSQLFGFGKVKYENISRKTHQVPNNLFGLFLYVLLRLSVTCAHHWCVDR
jgi:hypothetical protein